MEKVFEAGKSGTPPARKSAEASRVGGSERIEILTFLLVGKHLVRCGNFFEFGFARLIALVLVGMVLHREFTIGFFDFVGGGGPRDAEDVVGIFRHGLMITVRLRGSFKYVRSLSRKTGMPGRRNQDIRIRIPSGRFRIPTSRRGSGSKRFTWQWWEGS